MKAMLFRMLLLCVVAAGAAEAQTSAVPLQWANPQFLNCSSGTCAPLAGGFVFTYVAGTTTPLATCASPALTGSSCTTPNSTPIALNSSGFNAAGSGSAGIWPLPTRCYKFVVQDINLVTQWTVDNVCNQAAVFQAAIGATSNTSTSNGAALVGYQYPNSSIPRTVQSKLQDMVDLADFGATGNGSTDDSAAVAAAISAAAGIGPGAGIFCPPGTYNMGTTNIAFTAQNGSGIWGTTPGSCVLSWGSSSTGTAVTVGQSGNPTYYFTLSGLRLITASTTQNMLKGIRLHNTNLLNLEMEGPVNSGATNDCITLDGLTNDSILTSIMNVECTHMLRGIVALSTGSFNTVTTVDTFNFTFNGDSRTNAKAVDFGASGNGDGWVFTGGNFEAATYGAYSAGGAGLSMHGVLFYGVRCESISTACVYLEQFAYDNQIIGGRNMSVSGLAVCNSGNQQAFNSTSTAKQPLDNCYSSMIKTTLATDEVAFRSISPNAGTADLLDLDYASGGVQAFDVNHQGCIYQLGTATVTVCAGNGSPAGSVSAPLGSIYLNIAGGSGTSLYVKESGGSGNTGWVGK